MKQTTPLISVQNVSLGYDDFIVLHDLSFTVSRGDVFAIMGGSGSGKSTLLRAMTGLLRPVQGRIVVRGRDFWAHDDAPREIMRHIGVSFQSGALFSAMTVGENVALPIQQFTDYTDTQIADIVHEKLSLVGLGDFADFYPSELSGGMQKRAGLARALALNPSIVYFDEPSAGLDPVSSRRLDELLLKINRDFGTTIILVSHELKSIFGICNNSVFIDAALHTITAAGNPNELRRHAPNAAVQEFLNGGNPICENNRTRK